MSRTTTLVFGLFLLSTFTYPPSAAAQAVVDVTGEPIQNGGSYYMLPTIWAWGGGVELAKTGKETCPLSVVQSPSEVNNGLPVKISSMFKTVWVPEGRVDLSFTDDDVPSCVPTPSRWTVVEGLQEEEEEEGSIVKISGSKNPGYFLMERATSSASASAHTYKLSFCRNGELGCGSIGITRKENGERVLGVAVGNTFEFVLINPHMMTKSSATA